MKPNHSEQDDAAVDELRRQLRGFCEVHDADCNVCPCCEAVEQRRQLDEAIDRADDLSSQFDALEAKLQQAESDAEHYKELNANLAQELRAAEADNERLDWLESRAKCVHSLFVDEQRDDFKQQVIDQRTKALNETIERLQQAEAERDGMKLRYDTALREIEHRMKLQGEAEHARLQAEADKERLDWLDGEQALNEHGERWQSWEVTASENFRGDVRAAIDEARKK